MNFDDPATYSEKHHNSGLFLSPLTDFEDGDDFAAMDSAVSVASSEWRNVSSSGSSTSTEDDITVNDIVNWRELWDVWTSHHPVILTDIRDIPVAYPFCQDIYSVFQLAYSIPRSRFNVNALYNHVPDTLQNFLSRLVEIDPTVLSENASAYPQLYSEHGFAVASVAMDVHQAALRLTQEGGDSDPDDDWTTQVHNVLITRCARGRLLSPSEPWTLQSQERPYPQDDLAPISAKILRGRRLLPHAAILVVPEDGTVSSDQVLPTNSSNVPWCFAAVFSTRSQVASPLRDTPESVALRSFSLMATSTILSQMDARGINLPVFGVMFDRNSVRFHVDWSMTTLGNHISVPLPQTDTSLARLSPFRDFDLTLPQDSLRVAFILDALSAFAQCRITPAARAIFNSKQWTPQAVPHNSKSSSSPSNEISSEEKVQAWMQSGAVAAADIVN